MRTIKGACPQDCPDNCAWEVHVEDGRAVGLTGSRDHPFTQGTLCAKLKHYPERVYSPRRILHPLRRTGPRGEGRFERVSWDQAIEAVADHLRRAIAEHGPLSIMPHNFAGTFGLIQRYAGEPFLARLGATGLHPDICGLVAYDGVTTTIGPVVGVLPQDLVHSRLIILWGTNTVVTNLHQWSAVIRRAREAGAKIVVVDPVKTQTARRADWYVQPRPGTDAALALGMMHVIVRDDLHDRDYVERHTLGFAELRTRLDQYPPSRAADITGIPAADIEALARAYADTRPAVIRLLVGMERYSNGAATMRAIACLPALIGAWRDPGGGLCQFTAPLFWESLNNAALAAPPAVPRPGRMVHLAQIGRALTDATMAPPIRCLLVYNSNPVVTSPNQNLTRRGLLRDDLFIVVHEQFMTDTARYADYLLPATTQLEHLELVSSWGQTCLALNQPAIAPRGEAIPNTEFFRRLATAMGYTDDYLHTSDETRIRQLLDSRHPYLQGITYERLEREGWAALNLPPDWRPLAAGHYPTASGKCEFFSPQLQTRGEDPLPAYVPLDAANGGWESNSRYPLLLVSAKPDRFLNSSYADELRDRGAPVETTARIHPADAGPREIHAGDRVRVFNDLGEMLIRANVAADTPVGTISIPFGAWASLSPGGSSVSALTRDGLSTCGIGSNAFDSRVDVERAA